MILVDTSIWIEFFRGREPFFTSLKEQIARQNIFAPECVFGELLQGARDQGERALLTDYWQYLPRQDEAGLWLEAGSLSSEKRFVSKGVGLIDALIVVMAREHRSQIWTLDKKLLSVLEDKEIF